MKILSVMFILFLVFSITLQVDSKGNHLHDARKISSSVRTDAEVKGVVVIDSLHENDYFTDDNLALMVDDLVAQGYVVKLVSDYPTLADALAVANYFVMSAPYSPITTAEIADFVAWFEAGSANLLLASRGDYETNPSFQPNFQIDSLNALLSGLTATMRAQHDNVYTTDPSQRNPWYVQTSTFNVAYPSIFEGVSGMNFFSPSSIMDTATSEVLVFGNPMAYQTNQNGAPADTIYDDTDDDIGGDSIPLAVLEEVQLGTFKDRIITVGTTMWSDFDYADVDNDDIAFFNNILEYFRTETIKEVGEIVINLPDTEGPLVKITFPHPDATLQGTVTLSVDAIDPFGIDSYEIYVNDELRSSVSTYVWDTTQDADGDYTVKVDVKDPNGNVGTLSVNYKIQQGFTSSLNQKAKVMTYNIKQSGQLPAWLDVMKEENADIVLLVETGDFDDNNDKILDDVVDELNTYFFDEIAYSGYTLPNIVPDYNGITILSRYEITSSVKISSLTADDGSSVTAPLPFLHSELLINNVPVNVIGAHLTCCSGADNQAARYEQQESILNYMDDLGDVPIIYLGDMNSESSLDDPNSDLGSDPIDMVVDPDHPSASKIHTFVDVDATLNGDTGTSFIGSQLGRIDYIFVNQWFSSVISDSTTGDTASASIGSDHVPVDVLIDFSILGDGGSLSDTEKNETSDDSPLNYYPIGLIAIPIIVLVRRKLRITSI